MKRKLENTFSRISNFNCFACGPEHPFGLHLEFFYDDENREVSSRFFSGNLFAGFPGILHGGIQATILDEIAFWGAWARYQKSGFTYDLTVQYRKKCPTDQTIEALGIVGDVERRLVSTEVILRNPHSFDVYTQGVVRYYFPAKETT